MVTVTQIFDNVYVLMDSAECCCNLVVGKEKALVFDTGLGVDDFLSEIKRITDKPLLVINSHGHFDHIGGNYQFEQVYLHPNDMNIVQSYTKEILSKWTTEMIVGNKCICEHLQTEYWKQCNVLDFKKFDLGEMECEIILLPGHSTGSIGILIPALDILLAGDALVPVMCLIFQNHLSIETQYETLTKVKNLSFKYFLTSHYNQLFSKNIIDKMMLCIENSRDGRWHSYEYPKPPYVKGKIYMEWFDEEPIGIIINK